MNAPAITQESLDNSPNGRHARFIDLGEYGLKVYRMQVIRNSQFENQQNLNRVGLAPKCWECIVFTGPDGSQLYGFYTETAEIFDREHFETLGGWDCYYENDECEAYAYVEAWNDNVLSLNRKLSALGMHWVDAHRGNVGKDCNGNLVVIDCDCLYTDGTRAELFDLTTL